MEEVGTLPFFHALGCSTNAVPIRVYHSKVARACEFLKGLGTSELPQRCLLA